MEIEKFVGFAKFPFHVFDRNEIRIQDAEDFPGIFIVSRCLSSTFQLFEIPMFQNSNRTTFDVSKRTRHLGILDKAFKSILLLWFRIYGIP